DLAIAPWQRDAIGYGELLRHPCFTLHVVDCQPSLKARNLWPLLSLRALIKRTCADVVHLTYPVPFLKSLLPVPVVVTLHDLYPFDMQANFGRFKALFHRLILRVALHQADAVASVSDTTAHALARHL